MTNYKESGVDITAGESLVQRIKSYTTETRRSGVISSLGGFSSLFELPVKKYKRPVLVSSTDGVGTKLKVAFTLNQHNTVGIDLVAMCANDIIVQGAEPLFFLDYLATGRLNVDVSEIVIKGIADGCKEAGCALVGGETAEMPKFYKDGEYDLAGFIVGVVEKDCIVDGSTISPGDKVIGLASSGPHSNGYSLLRYLIEDEKGPGFDTELEGKTLGEHLITPTKIYVKSILEVLDYHDVKGMSHITGGGLLCNIPRMLPVNVTAQIDKRSWYRHPIFEYIQKLGGISEDEMLTTFNCGIGMVIVVSESESKSVCQRFEDCDIESFIIGEVVNDSGYSSKVVFND